MFRLTIALAAAVLGHASSVTIEGFANTVMQDNFDAGEVRLLMAYVLRGHAQIPLHVRACDATAIGARVGLTHV
jgi:hypothetical protein